VPISVADQKLLAVYNRQDAKSLSIHRILVFVCKSLVLQRSAHSKYPASSVGNLNLNA